MVPRRAWHLFGLFSVALLASRLAWGWGSGHDPLNHLAVEVMPSEIRQLLGDEYAAKVVTWSHTPDDFTPWTKLTRVTIAPDDLAVLAAHGLKHPYALHSHRGQAVNFILLVRAFKARSPERAALWMACLLHTFADEAASNHDPLIHFMTYAFRAGYAMRMGDGIGLDFGNIARTPEGKAIIRDLLKDVRPKPLCDQPREALLKVMMAGLEGNAYMTQRGAPVAATYALDASADTRSKGIVALAELGIYGVQHAADAIVTAAALAAAGKMPELTDDVEKEYQRRRAEFVRRRPLAHDSLFADLLKGGTTDQPAVGALIEPSVSMNQAKLGFSAKLIMASVMRTLANADVPYRPVDVRTMEATGLPAPQAMPVLVVCAGGFHVSSAGRQHLKAYVDAGGRLLWIGGEHRGQLGALSQSLVRVDEALLPVSPRYGKDSPALKKARVRFRDAFAEALGDKERRFTHNPNTRAGWQKPLCRYAIRPAAARVRVLAELRVDDRVVPIAGLSTNAEGKPQHVFLPEYLVSPYLLSDQTSIADPSKPVLDAVGEKVLLASLRLLAPALLRR